MKFPTLHNTGARKFARYAALAILAANPGSGFAQSVPAEAPAQTLTLTLEEAIQIALVRNYAIQNLRLDVENAEAQVREAWGQVLPRVDVTSSYTRNLKSPNPFAGSDAGGLFGSLGFVDWLSFNERARTDDDPGTNPMSFTDFAERQREGMDEAGIVLGGSDNPFSVPNQFSTGVTIEQPLFNGTALAAIKGAERLKTINQRAADRQEELLVDQVRQAYYTALLTQQQAEVAVQSVVRTQETVEEVAKQVSQGVAPKFNRLSSEVELANLQTQLVQIRNQASLGLDNLKLALGIPVGQPIRLEGDLEAANRGGFLTVSSVEAFDMALENRPDLEQARIAVELRRIDRDMTRAQYLPQVSAFLGMNYIGNVPDSRVRIFNRNPDDPFEFEQENRGFFSQDYWNPGVNVGLRMSWNIFNGFQTSAQSQQRQIAIEKAENDAEQLIQSVHLEVERALKNLQTAQQRIVAQEQNVARAELSYQFAQARLAEGVASQLEEREASEQLDQSRLNHLQAVYDYLVARSAFEAAVGAPLPAPDTLRLTSN